LSELSEAAEKMGAGDLETPIRIVSGWIEIDQLAHQLESSRRNLYSIQQFTRHELRQIALRLGAIREGVLTFDMNGLVTWTNSNACHILGYDSLQMLRMHYSEVFKPAPGEAITLDDVIQPPPYQTQANRLTILNAQGRVITLNVSHSFVEMRDQNTTYPSVEHVLVLRDISEEQSINRLRSEFLANVAHEFRTPLSAISASAELLVDEGCDMNSAELSQLGRTIHLSAVHLQTLVNNLLESAIIEAGVFRLRLRPMLLQELLRNVADMMFPLLERRQQQLEVIAP
jgi:two-component system sensor histidine kinase ResE